MEGEPVTDVEGKVIHRRAISKRLVFIDIENASGCMELVIIKVGAAQGIAFRNLRWNQGASAHAGSNSLLMFLLLTQSVYGPEEAVRGVRDSVRCVCAVLKLLCALHC